ncbi:hypothetical protein D3OALGA1CA_5869 [Olavius algarvensis associated proteobacterium Delta 3]|nr:hypothetical protein D3OALGB2SA_1302 [Olavius algarvensis associated proteobacterium Delta 3]CAB5172831.1 hypothetical protein D3OALGA1CA_5869 [Olavius algarvensis associated proteobacterium Delta 3]
MTCALPSFERVPFDCPVIIFFGSDVNGIARSLGEFFYDKGQKKHPMAVRKNWRKHKDCILPVNANIV